MYLFYFNVSRWLLDKFVKKIPFDSNCQNGPVHLSRQCQKCIVGIFLLQKLTTMKMIFGILVVIVLLMEVLDYLFGGGGKLK